ncbi:MAG: DUF1579 domain-containing protein [Phycisphaerales bacterium]
MHRCRNLMYAGAFTALGALGATGLGFVMAQPEGGEMPSPEEMQEMMEKMYAAMTPGEGHEKLDYFVGEWNTTMRIYMGGPGSPPVESTGTSSIEWILDGRFLREHMKSEIMMPDPETGAMAPMSYEGIGTQGYDNYKNLYVSSWVDSMNTHLLTMRGAADPSGKVFTYYGEMDEPSLDVGGRMVKYKVTIQGDDRFIFEMTDLHAGENYKVMETVYERQ